MKIDRKTNIGVIISKGGNSHKVIARMNNLGIEANAASEPRVVNPESHRRFVKNIFSLREKAAG